MADSLRETLEAAIESEQRSASEENLSTEAESKVTDSPAPGEGSSATEEVASTPGESKTPEAKTGEEKAPEAKPGEVKPGEAKPEEGEPAGRRHRIDRPPESWKNEAKSSWHTLPLGVRQEIHRREMHINSVLQEASQFRTIAQQVNEAASPFKARLDQVGATPVQAMRSLLQADFVLSTSTPVDRAKHMARMIQQYSVDLGLLDEALAGTIAGEPQRKQNDEVQQLLARELAPVRQLLNTLTSEQKAQQEQMRASAVSEIEAMATDPNYPYFDEVRIDMADIIDAAAKRGQQLPLKEAYRRAVLMNPDLAETVINQQVSDVTRNRVQEANANASRARSAAVSVSGSAAGTATQEVDPSDLRALLAKNMQMADGRL